MLEIKDLTKYYGSIKGVENINLKINKGEIFGFIGPNGAGKSTTIRCVMNLLNKDSGTVTIDEMPFNKENYRFNEHIGYLPSEVNLYDDYTVKQMLDYSASFYKKDCSKKIKHLVDKLELDTSKKIEDLSLGNLKKVGIVLAMMHDPKLIIMDEATSGLDPLMQEVFYGFLKEEKKLGTTIFFSSHNLNEVKRICDRVGVIRNGDLVAIEPVNKLFDKQFLVVTINSKDVIEIKKDKNVTVLEERDDLLRFAYHGNGGELIKLLNKIKLDKVLIEEPSIEEVFMHFYE